MICPKCGHEQSEGWLSCHKCHVIFSRWDPNQPHTSPEEPSLPEPPPPPSPAPTPSGTIYSPPPPEVYQKPPSGSLPLLAHLALILAVGLVLLWVLSPRGLPIPIGAIRDAQNGFAMKVPSGWLPLTLETIEAFVRQSGGVLPANVQSAALRSNMAANYVMMSRSRAYAPSVNVIVVPGRPPAISEKSKREAAMALRQAIGSLLEEYSEEPLKITTVDLIKSMQFEYAGIMKMDLGGDLGTQSFALRFIQVFVPARSKSFLITFSASQTQFEELETEFSRILNSFRVTKRPARFDAVTQGGVVGGLLGMLGYLLLALFKRFSDR